MTPRRYTFKLYPSAAQDTGLHDQARMCASLWNALLSMYEARQQEQRQTWIDSDGNKHRGVSRHADEPWRMTKWTCDYWITELLAECPEWRALSTWTPRGVGRAFYKSLQAFYRRAKQGAGKQSGYPRYRSTRRLDNVSIPHRFASGCKLTPVGDERFRRDKKAGSARSWLLYLRGVPGLIRARGEFPSLPIKFTDSDVMFRNGSWWLSVCVDMPARMTRGDEEFRVEFDLIDEFARVERVNGLREAVDKSARAESKSPNHLNTIPGGSDRIDDAGSDERGFDPRWAPSSRVSDRIDGSDERVAECPGADARGKKMCPAASLSRAASLCERADAVKSERDKRYRARRGSIPPSRRWLRETRRASKLTSRAQRICREAAHEWSTAIIRRASALSVVLPPIKEQTSSPRGDAKEWGGAVAVVSALNRSVLSMAPATVKQMLAYKAAEAGIPCKIINDENHALSVGRDLVTATKRSRKVRRELRRQT